MANHTPQSSLSAALKFDATVSLVKSGDLMIYEDAVPFCSDADDLTEIEKTSVACASYVAARRLATWRERKASSDLPPSALLTLRGLAEKPNELDQNPLDMLGSFVETESPEELISPAVIPMDQNWSSCKNFLVVIFCKVAAENRPFPVLKKRPEPVSVPGRFKVDVVEAELDDMMDMQYRKKIGYEVVMINPCSSIGEMRNFAYQYCFQNGCFPVDSEIDDFLLNVSSTLFRFTPNPSRRGVRFIRARGMILDWLFGPRNDYIANNTLLKFA